MSYLAATITKTAGRHHAAACRHPHGAAPEREQRSVDAIVTTILEPPVRLTRDGSYTEPPSTMTAADLDPLLRRVAQRDVDAFTDFYDATRTRVYGLVVRVLRDRGYSEETTQDVYLQVWRTAESYDPASGSALAWLLTLAHRRAVDRVRSEQAASQRESRYGAATVEPADDHVSEAVISREERRRVVACLEGLTDVQRECIELAYYQGMTYREVSERLSANLATVKSRMRDALRSLRNCLGMR
jgi:RNA polymerase sigma-70 factor (ECF subfamily)